MVAPIRELEDDSTEDRSEESGAAGTKEEEASVQPFKLVNTTSY